MKTGKSLSDLAAELQRRADAKQDLITDTRHIELSDDGSKLVIPSQNRSYDLTQFAHGQIAEHLDIPRKFYEALKSDNPDMLRYNVEQLFKRKPARRMVRTLDGKARAFLSDRYRRIDNEDIADAALNALLNDIPGANVISTDVTDSKLYIKALFPRKEVVKVGDEVQAGVVISNGEIGNGALNIRVMSYRLWCLNGATHESVIRQSHVGRQVTGDDTGIVFRDETIAADDKALMMKVRDAISSAQGDLFTKVVQGMQALLGAAPMVDPIKAVEVLAKKVGLTTERKNSVLENLIRERDYTPYGVVQAVTNVANNVESYDEASELEELGGNMMRWTPGDWNELQRAA